MSMYHSTLSSDTIRLTAATGFNQQRLIESALDRGDWCALLYQAAHETASTQTITQAALQVPVDLDATLEALTAWAGDLADGGYGIKTSAAWGTVLSGLAAAIRERSISRRLQTGGRFWPPQVSLLGGERR